MRSTAWIVLLGSSLLIAHSTQAAEPAKPAARPVIGDLLGVNGHTVQFRPKLYRPVCKLVRDYHSIEWDLGKETDFVPQFPFARNKVNWETVYGPWQAEGFVIDCSIMFPHTPQDKWKDLDRDARAYGEKFAKFFGPSSEKKLVSSAEIGNEPGHYDDAHYRRLFENMARGMRAGDPKLTIVTCAAVPGKSHKYAKSLECVKGLESLYDVINLHSYAEVEGWPTWKRSYPEDPKIRYLKEIAEVLAWRDQHAPGKPVWLTEFGWDASTKPAPKTGDFAKWQGNTETQQAQYLVRSVLVFSGLDIARAYIYFFNDSDEPQVHGSSGLTRNFQPKPSYHALAHLQKSLGEYRLARIREAKEGELYIYEYEKPGQSGERVLAVWSPTGSDRSVEIEMDLQGAALTKAERMPIAAGVVLAEKIEVAGGKAKVTVSESPVYLWISGVK